MDLENRCKHIAFATSKGYLGILDMNGNKANGQAIIHPNINTNKLDGRNGSLYFSDEQGIHIFGGKSIVKYKNITAFRVLEGGDIYFGIKVRETARLKRYYKEKGYHNEKNEVQDTYLEKLHNISAIDTFNPRLRVNNWDMKILADYWTEWVDSSFSDDLSGYAYKGRFQNEDHWLKWMAKVEDMRIIGSNLFFLLKYCDVISKFNLVCHNDNPGTYHFISSVAMREPSCVKFYKKDEKSYELTSLGLFNDQLIASNYDEIRSVDKVLYSIDYKRLGRITSVAGF